MGVGIVNQMHEARAWEAVVCERRRMEMERGVVAVLVGAAVDAEWLQKQEREVCRV